MGQNKTCTLFGVLFCYTFCFVLMFYVRLIRDGEPWTATSSFTQLRSSVFQGKPKAFLEKRAYRHESAQVLYCAIEISVLLTVWILF